MACGFMGQLIFAGCGGILFDRVGKYMPFVFVGALDCIMVLFTLIMGCGGCLKNDIRKETEKPEEGLNVYDADVVKNVSINQ